MVVSSFGTLVPGRGAIISGKCGHEWAKAWGCCCYNGVVDMNLGTDLIKDAMESRIVRRDVGGDIVQTECDREDDSIEFNTG